MVKVNFGLRASIHCLLGLSATDVEVHSPFFILQTQMNKKHSPPNPHTTGSLVILSRKRTTITFIILLSSHSSFLVPLRSSHHLAGWRSIQPTTHSFVVLHFITISRLKSCITTKHVTTAVPLYSGLVFNSNASPHSVSE